ncbi:histidine kinase [Streptomyces natalensis ATCC 27448]|uniref:histidine kinase n=1 Tax=Streptomyces natalensis ATCC 27448 TaxID=1240678 RepID=A0A0D7CW84_9ACTN|nr:histidine kinase [Streptomyces natalensis ATCC 27448]
MRRLRWRLTALFTLTSALGLIALAAFAIHSDSVARHRQLDASLELQASQAIPQLSQDDKGLATVGQMLDVIDANCPTLTVFDTAAGDLTTIYTPPKPCAKARTADLRDLAAATLRQQSYAWRDTRAKDGHPLRLLAVGFTGPDGHTYTGAVVTATDTSQDQAAHRELALLLASGCAVLVLVSAVVGHLLSGRATRPALTALHQQETFLADAAHDLRTPTASLRTLAETALRDDSSRTAALERTVRLAGRMGDLIDGLLTRARLMAGVGALAREPLRLDQLVESVADETPTEAHHVTLQAEPVIVNADPDLLRRAIANLLGNALAHGHSPGRPAEVELTVAADGTLTVDDAGPGIPAELTDSLFERFQSASGSSGLGLSIASWVAHTHGGTLAVGTSPRGGARFTLRLPAHHR